MNSRSQIARITLVFAILTALFIPSRGYAAPASFAWGSFDSSNYSTTYGVYNADNTTVLQTGDLAQLIWAGPNGVIDPPSCDGTTTGDDEILDISFVQNGPPLPPPMRNKGYITPSEAYTFDTESPQNGGIVYIRAWNSNAASTATAYGNSLASILADGGTYNALRWFTSMTNCAPLAVTLASFTVSNRQGILVVAWETTSEVNNQGFHLYRNTDPIRADEPVAFIPSQAPGSSQGFAYEWIDNDVMSGQTYYWLEDIDLNGTTTLHGPISATVNAPTAVTISGLNSSSQSAGGWLARLITAAKAFVTTTLSR